MKKIILLALVVLLTFISACTSSGDNQRPEILVASASSLTKALDEINREFQKDSEISVSFSFGSSGKLAQQIKNGAPADIFLSASDQDMNVLEEANFIVSETRTNFTSNSLALIMGKHGDSSQETDIKLLDTSKIVNFAIGNPATVPAGRYAKEMLENSNMYTALSDKFVYGKDVRQVLTFVETGNVEMGIVFESDVYNSDKVAIIQLVDESLHTPAIYPGAVLKDSSQIKEATTFLEFLTSEKAQSIFKKHGFGK